MSGSHPAGASSGSGVTTRVSVANSGGEANNASRKPTISADGRYVAFTSAATNLVPSDTNNEDDIFVYDRATGATSRVSVASDGSQAVSPAGARWTQDQAISADGRYVAFVSTASTLVPGDEVATPDLFVHDRLEATTTRASTLDLADRVVNPVFSADGRYLAFDSAASNLVSGDTNSRRDVFVLDRQTGTTSRVSVPNPGQLPPPLGSTQTNADSRFPALSADGRYVAFQSEATNLLATGEDTNSQLDVFVYDREAATTSRVSVASDGTQANGRSTLPSISADGRYVAFDASASNLVPSDSNGRIDVFVRDRQASTTALVSLAGDGSQGNEGSDTARISPDGVRVAFRSVATNLVSGDTNGVADVFVRDIAAAATTRVSVASSGAEGNGDSAEPSVSADGRYVAFRSTASNLVPSDDNAVQDVFVHDREGAAIPPTLSAADGSVDEGDTDTRPLTFTISLDRAAESPVTVAFSTSDGTAVAPGDYQQSSGTVSFAPGTTSQTVDVTVNGDTEVEGNETFTLTISDPVGATITRGTATGTIVDSEPVLAVGDVALHEGDTGTRAAVFTVSLSRPLATAVTVAYATSNSTAVKGSDYTRTVGTLDFAPGTVGAKVKVPVAGDTVDEVNETFTLNLANPQGVTIADGVGVGTILDDDPTTVGGRRLAIGDVVVHEGDEGTRVAFFRVSLSTAARSTITVDFATHNSSATAPGDYEARSGTVTFAPGATAATVKITIAPDAADEPNEMFSVLVSNVTGQAVIVDNTGTGTIIDDD